MFFNSRKKISKEYPCCVHLKIFFREYDYQVLQILKHLTSRRPLTSALLRDNCELGPSSIINWAAGQFPMLTGCEGRPRTFLRGRQCVPLVEWSTRNIIGLEAQEDIADFMFSFLAIPVRLCCEAAQQTGFLFGMYKQFVLEY
ncbi:hypothetical protein MLD38_017685 [Melastoma candidum]|uniref:Uncharacterized protein n=1 Tax=Melastoma candidum TaxID=119954 RepID=A0ACB9QUY2_9MYRT|nr:hypothetical protein MLD38_017685 [Melastoma candidum]